MLRTYLNNETGFTGFIVDCLGVIQLGGLVRVPLKYKASKSVLFTNDPSVVKIKNTGLSNLTHFILFHSALLLLRSSKAHTFNFYKVRSVPMLI